MSKNFIKQLKLLIKETADSEDLEGMKMNIVQMQLDIERLDREISKIPMLPSRTEFWGGIISVAGIIIGLIALVK